MQMSNVFVVFLSLVVFYFLYLVFIAFYNHLMSKKISSGASILQTGCVQQDPENAATRKRVRKAFEEQQQSLEARAMKSHDLDCPDTWECTKDPCFVWEPDKIVGKPMRVKRKTDDERREQEQERRAQKPDKPFKRKRTLE